VSHDRYFLDRTVDRLFCFEDGRLQRFEGNYSAYLERQAAVPAAESASASGPASESATAAAAAGESAVPAAAALKVRRRSFKETRELADLDTQLPAWEQRRAELEAQLAAGGSDYAALEALSAELSELLARIERGEERWLALSELAG
jgi:ATP-binding cassette subfamily F protein uup